MEQVGIPAIFFTLLMRYRHRFAENSVRLQLGFLYDGYLTGNWWFELIDMMHKLVRALAWRAITDSSCAVPDVAAPVLHHCRSNADRCAASAQFVR